MGAAADRITAADFLIPPELQAWTLAAAPAGRIGGVRLELTAAPGGTRLGDCYQQVPLRVMPIFRFPAKQPGLLFLLNPTAGLLDGDAQLVQIAAGPHSRAVVAGQSATRLHPCLHGFATQQWRIRVEPGAVLVGLPGPAIPFQGCRYFQRVEIDLAAGAGLVWGDIWVAGRYARGEASERFQFAVLIQELQVRRKGRLVFRDRFCWRGPWDVETAAWHFGNAPACGSLFATGPLSPARGGCLFPTAAGDTCLRWCGEVESVVNGLVESALRAGALLAGGPSSSPWLLDTHELAPNHWFSQQW